MNIHLLKAVITTNTNSEGLAASHHDLFSTDSKLIKEQKHEYLVKNEHTMVLVVLH